MVADENLVMLALEAGGRCKMWIGFFTVRNFVVSPGQMRVIAVITTEDA